MGWAANKWWNPYAVSPLMRQARRQGSLSPEAAAAAVEHPSDEEMAAAAAVVDAWMIRRVSEGRPPARLRLLWLLLFKCNGGDALQLAIVSIIFIVFRIANSFAFSILMSALANSPADLIFLTVVPSSVVAAAVYAAFAVGASAFNNLLDLSARHLGTKIRMQLVWCVQNSTLRGTTAAAAPFTHSKAVSLAGTDAMAANWTIAMLPYAVVIPIEIAVQILLSVSVVGSIATGFAMIPLAIFLVVKTVVVKVASKKQESARGIQAQRFDILSDAIESNAVVKLMGTDKQTLSAIAALRHKEERKLGWVAFSNACTLFSQCTLAVQMSWAAMVVRANREDLFSSSSIMTALGFYRTIADYDLYRIHTSIQCLIVGAASLAHHYSFFEAAVRAGAGTGGKGGNSETAGSGDSTGSDPAASKDADNPLVDFQNAAFSWSLDDDKEPTLKGLTFVLPRGKLVGVAGPIGSGKSSLLLALLGELRRCEGVGERHPDWQHPVAYMPQKHWLKTGTLRDNVCHASPVSAMGPAWLQTVVEACGMTRDIDDFPDGLDHFIGEAGSSLSGGQRARVSLARAVHAAAAITVLDDPLCALDPGLGAEVFRRTMAPGGLLRGLGRSVILVTTNPAMLAQCDVVAVVCNGTVTAVAPPEQLDPSALEYELPKVDSVTYASNEEDNTPPEHHHVKIAHRWHGLPTVDSLTWFRNQDPMEVACGDLDLGAIVEVIEEEEFDMEGSCVSEDGDGLKDGTDATEEPSDAPLLNGVEVKYRSTLSACRAMLGWAAALAGVLLVASQGLVLFWTVTVRDSLDTTNSDSQFRNYLMRVSGGLLAPVGLSAGVGVLLHFWSFLKGSTSMQFMAATAVLASPYSFFSVNPASKIFNTISADSQLVEQVLSVSMCAMWSLTAQLIGTIVFSIISLWYLVFLFLPLAAVYVWIQRRYSASVMPFARADGIARNPLSAAIATSFEGAPVLRAFQTQSTAWSELSVAIMHARGTSLATIRASGWLTVIASVFIFNAMNTVVAIALAVALDPGPQSIGPTVMSNVASLGSIVVAAALLVSNVEVTMASVQRLCVFAELPSEEHVVRHPDPELIAQAAAAVKEAGGGDGDDPPAGALLVQDAEEEPPEGWPSAGVVAYRRAYAAYVWGTPPALKGVTIDIPAGSSCALVGRSGSGKSTAFLALTGLIPVVAGAVEIDGIAVQHVPLRTLRAALAVVPQQPVLFAGGLRPNLDPQGQHGDAALWEALRAVDLIDAVTAAGGLGVDPLAAGMSQGQRQLMCLARALLRDCSILLLDEANASVDAATERQMAVTVAAFGAGELTAATGAAPRRRTVIEVAHRMEGVLEMDQVVVLGAGVVLEAGPPRELAQAAGGEFASMLSAQGITI